MFDESEEVIASFRIKRYLIININNRKREMTKKTIQKRKQQQSIKTTKEQTQ